MIIIENMPDNNQQDLYEEYPYGSPDPTPNFSDEQFKYLLNNDDTLVELEKYLRGIEYDPDKEKWVKMRRATLNEVGVNAIMKSVKLRCGRGFNLGIFKSNEIKEIVKSFSNELTIILNTQYKKFELSIDDIQILHSDVVDFVWSNLSRSEGGWQQKLIGKIWKGGEMTRPNMSQGSNDLMYSPKQGRISRTINRMMGG